MKSAATPAAAVALPALLLAAACVPRCSAVTPVQKVVELLQGMVEKAKAAKKEEAVQWTAYKQWCGDAELQRQTAVKSANLQIESLQADIERCNAEVVRLEEEIKGHEKDIEDFAKTVKDATEQRKNEREAYEVTHQDYSESIHAIAEALQVLKEQNFKRPQAAAAAASALLQQARIRGALASFLAEGPLSSSRAGAAAMLEEAASAPPGEANAYEFQSGNVVNLLMELKGKFRDELTSLEKEEMERQHAYERLAQDMTSQTAGANNEKDKKTKNAAEQRQASADANAQLVTVTGTRDGDQKFLEDLDTTCNQKSSDFQAREKLRVDEIEALEKALAILQGPTVAGKADKYLPAAFTQSARSARALVQLRGGPEGASPADRSASSTAAAAAYLQRASGRLESTVLAAAAARLRDSSDPFEKVKQLIQQLIDRLQQEAADEAQHKQWCDTELSTNEQTRSKKSAEVEGLHTTIEQLQTDIALLKKEVADLSEAVAQLTKDISEAEKLRAEEKAKNEDTIADAAGAQLAIADALNILKDFYSQAAEATAFVQRGYQPAAPAIFDKPYQGRQSESNNILAFLEVIQSDFARLEQETSDAEHTAADDHATFMSDANADVQAKNGDITTKNNAKTQKEVDLQTAFSDLELVQSELDSALAYYDKLKPSCVGVVNEGTDGGGSFGERVRRREEEIASLKEALDIISGQTIVGGPDSLYSSVDGGNRGWDVGITADTAR